MYGGSIVSVSILYFFISFLIFGAVSILSFFRPDAKLLREKTERSRGSSETYHRYKVHSCAVLGDHTRTISPRSRNVSFLETRRKGTICLFLFSLPHLAFLFIPLSVS